MTKSKQILFVALGVIFWFQAAMIINYFGESVFSENNSKLIIIFVLAIPITIVSMYIAKILTKLKFSELLKPVVVMTFTATFLDAIALAWFRQIYSQSFEVALYGSAWILWGAGLGLFFAYYLDHGGSKQKT